jgi:hypothetical protein
MQRVCENDPRPAEIGNATYAYPAESLCFFYYSLGLQRLKRASDVLRSSEEPEANGQNSAFPALGPDQPRLLS